MPFFPTFFKNAINKISDGIEIGSWSLRRSNFDPMNPFYNMGHLATALMKNKPILGLITLGYQLATVTANDSEIYVSDPQGGKYRVDTSPQLTATAIYNALLENELCGASIIPQPNSTFTLTLLKEFCSDIIYSISEHQSVKLYSLNGTQSTSEFLSCLADECFTICNNPASRQVSDSGRYAILAVPGIALIFAVVCGIANFCCRSSEPQQRNNDDREMGLIRAEVAAEIRPEPEAELEHKIEVTPEIKPEIKPDPTFSERFDALSIECKKLLQDKKIDQSSAVYSELKKLKEALDAFGEIYICPIGQVTIMNDPISVSSSGHTYERQNLLNHMLTKRQQNLPVLCPLTLNHLTETPETLPPTHQLTKNGIVDGLQDFEKTLKKIQQTINANAEANPSTPMEEKEHAKSNSGETAVIVATDSPSSESAETDPLLSMPRLSLTRC